MVWHKAKTWNETAFVGHALPELTNAMGLHLIISDLDRPHGSDLDYALIDPGTVAQLRADWVRRAASCFPEEWHTAIDNCVASTDNFYLALVSHLDQVRFSIRAPKWIGLVRGLALTFAFMAVAAFAIIIGHPYGIQPAHALIVAAEVLPIVAAILGFAGALGRDFFRQKRAAVISDRVRDELRAAIHHSFGRPVTQFASEMDMLKELSRD